MSEASGRRAVADGAALRALGAARRDTRAMSDRLLDHAPDIGDLATQRLLDAWVEQAADALRAVSEAAEERLLDLGRTSPPDGIPTPYAVGGPSGSVPSDAPEGPRQHGRGRGRR
jgi:hypothetical protein